MADTTINFPGTGGVLVGSAVEVNFPSAIGSLSVGSVTTADMPITTLRVTGSATITPFVYICDQGNNRIQCLDYDLNFLFEWGAYGSGNGQFSSPYGVCNDGEFVYVTDSGNHRVQKFTLLGAYVSQWGSYGSAQGQFSSPKGIAVDSRFVYVVDQGNNRFQIFTKAGVLIMAYGEYGLGADLSVFNAPTKCYVDSYFLYIDDTGNGLIKWYALNFIGDYGSVVLPAISITATGAARQAFGNVILPALAVSIAATGLSGTVAEGDVKLPVIRISATGHSDGFANGNVILPAITINASGSAGRIATGAIVLPALRINATGYSNGFANGAVILPPLSLDAFGHSTPETVTYSGIAVNVKTKAISEYTNYPFNSLILFGGKYYGVNESGFFLLEGDDDNGTAIDASYRSGTFDLHVKMVRRIYDAYIKWRSNASAILTVHEGKSDSTPYDISEDSNIDTDEEGERIKFAKGHKGQYNSYEFSNVDGSDFDVMGIRVKTRPIPTRER